MTIEAKRTPDERFQNLPGYDFEPHYIDDLEDYEGLRMHYVDEGPSDADTTFLCLHGEPTWAYLYRKMIPVFVEAGHRVIAPDFFGFGRSDKPVALETYTFHFHRFSICELFERLELSNVCLVVQDWGGLIGLTLPMQFQKRITRLLIMNTALATGEPAGEGFEQWKSFVAANPDFSISKLMKRAAPALSDEELAAYEAPFPDISYRAGVTMFPQLVMVEPDMLGVNESRLAASYIETSWTGQAFMAIGMTDPVLGPPVMLRLRDLIPGCSEPLEIAEGGHFVQEHGDQVAKAALEYFRI
jgi:haloalkane dehalogenase